MVDTTTSELASQIEDFVASVSVRDELFYEWQTGSANGGPNNDGTYPLTDFTGFTRFLKSPAAMLGSLVSPVGTISVLIATRVFATQALLYADLTPADGQFALVHSDPNPANNDLYIKMGATGAGTWSGPSGIFAKSARAFIQPLVDEAEASATAAGAAALSAVADRIAAEGASVIAQAAQGASQSAQVGAETARNGAQAAQAGTIAALAGTSLSNATLNAASRTVLAGLSTSLGLPAYLTEAGAEGLFKWNPANLSAKVAIDSTKGIYVAPSSALTGASGAWVRQFNVPIQVDWFLVTPGVFTTSAIIQKIEDLRDNGQPVRFGRGTYAFGGIKILKEGHWGGVGKGTVISHIHPGGVLSNTFGAMTQGGTRFSHMRFTGHRDASNADARFPIYFSTRHTITDADTGIAKDPEDLECDHLWFDNCDTGIRSSYDGIGPFNDIPGTTWYTPRRVRIHDCVFDNVLYQPVIPEGHDIVVEHCFFRLLVKPAGGYRPFSHSLRIIGCNRVDIRNNRFEVPADYLVISTQLAGVDNGPQNDAFRNARNVTIEDNRFTGGHLQCQTSADLLKIKNNNFWNDPQQTVTVPPPLLFIASSATPIYFGKIEFDDNYAAGYPKIFDLTNTACHQVSFKRNTMIGNKKTGGVNEIFPLRIQINDGVKLQDGVTQLPAPVLVEIEDNNIFCNPSTTGLIMSWVGNVTGMHIRYAGNKVTERLYATAGQVGRAGGLSGTEAKLSISKTTAFITASSIVTDLSEDVVGDNVAMPAGFYASLMQNSFFRPEQTVGSFPASYA